MIIVLLFFPAFAFANERIDMAKHRVLSLMQLPDSKQAVVGVLNSETAMAAFAICDLDGKNFVECRVNAEQRFSLEKMGSVREKFQQELRSITAPKIDPFEIGVMAALRLNTGQIAMYYMLKPDRAAFSEQTIQGLKNLFNTNPGSPVYVRFPADSDKVRILTALQFAASAN